MVTFYFKENAVSLRFYEAIVALNTETSSDDQKKLFDQIQTVIKEFSGSLHHIDILGSRSLANTGRNKKIKRALYFHLSYKALPSAVIAVEKVFRMRDFVLLFHHEKLDDRISLDKHQEKFEQILKESKEREDERQARIQIKRKRFQSDSPSKEGVHS